MASPIRLSRRSTRKHPSRAQVTLQVMARTMAQSVSESMNRLESGASRRVYLGNGDRPLRSPGSTINVRQPALAAQLSLQLRDRLGGQQPVDRLLREVRHAGCD